MTQRDETIDEILAAFLQKRESGETVNASALIDAHPEHAGEIREFLGDLEHMEGVTGEAAGEQVGALIGPYKLREEIGKGGFGVVYLAEQTEPVKRRVALKVIKPGMDTGEVIGRFEAERQALALMDHPNIAHVLDAGATDAGRPYIVMELIKGIPITEYCDQCSLPIRDRLTLFRTVCQAVQHAHQKGIIHRDVKPSNVLVAIQDGQPVPKVIDFGVAKATGQRLTEHSVITGFAQMLGTPLYMSPEQAEMSPLDVDTRSDIYSLGVLLYELLTGTTPIARDQVKTSSYDEIRRKIREEEPLSPSARISTLDAANTTIAERRRAEPRKLAQTYRGDLDWIVMKALEKDRTRRYETASSFAEDISRYLCDEPVLAGPPSTAYRFRKFVRRNKAALAAGVAMAALLVAGTVVSTWQWWRAEASLVTANELRIKETIAREDADAAREDAEKAREKANAATLETKAALEAEQAALEQEQQQRKYAEAIADFVRDDFLALTTVSGQDAFGGQWLNKDATLGDLLDRAAAKLRFRKDLEPVAAAGLFWIVGWSYNKAGESDKGIPFLQRSLALSLEHLGKSDPKTLQVQVELAQAVGRMQEARSLLEEDYHWHRANLGTNHPATLESLNRLGHFYSKQRDYDEAIPLLEQYLEQHEKKLGPAHRETVLARANLGGCFLMAGRFDEALPILEEVSQSNLAEPRTRLLAKNNLAALYYERRELSKSIPLFEQLVPEYTQTFHRGHASTLWAIGNLGANYLLAGRLEEAIPLLEEVAKASQRNRKLWVFNDALEQARNMVRGVEDAAQVVGDPTSVVKKLPSPHLAGLEFVTREERDSLIRVTSVEVSPDGKHLYTAAWEASAINVFQRDPASGALTHVQEMRGGDLGGAVAIRLSPDGRHAVATAFNADTAVLYRRDAETGELTQIHVVRHGQDGVSSLNGAMDVVFSPDSQFVYVIADQDGGNVTAFQVTDEHTLQFVQANRGEEECFANVRGIVMHPDGKTLYVTSADAGTLVVLDRDPDSGETAVRQIVQDGEGGVEGLAGVMWAALSPDCRHLYTSSGRFSGDNSVGVFAVGEDGRLTVVQEIQNGQDGLTGFAGGNEITVSRDGQFVYAVATVGDTVACFRRDAATGKLQFLEAIRPSPDRIGAPAGICTSPDDRYVYIAAEQSNAVTIFRRDSHAD